MSRRHSLARAFPRIEMARSNQAGQWHDQPVGQARQMLTEDRRKTRTTQSQMKVVPQ